MEQVIWLYVGVITALISIGIIAGIVMNGQEQSKQQDMINSLNLLKQKADFVCGSEVGTSFTQKVSLGSSSRLVFGSITSSAPKICLFYQQETNCVKTNCPVIKSVLDLNTEEIKQLYQIHEFECVVEKTDQGVLIECSG
jgi:hypothetical protein